MNHDDTASLWYIREADGLYSDNTVMRKVTAGGIWAFYGHYTAVAYDVASVTVEAALDFIREVEPMIPGLELAEVGQETPRSDLPQGVYWRGSWVNGSQDDRTAEHDSRESSV